MQWASFAIIIYKTRIRSDRLAMYIWRNRQEIRLRQKLGRKEESFTKTLPTFNTRLSAAFERTGLYGFNLASVTHK